MAGDIYVTERDETGENWHKISIMNALCFELVSIFSGTYIIHSISPHYLLLKEKLLF